MSSAAPPTFRLGHLLALAWPIILTRSTQTVMGLADTVMTAPLGQEAIAAVTTGGMDVYTITILPMGLVFIVQSFAAQFTGAGDHAAARRYAWYGLILSLAAGLLGVLALPGVGAAVGALDFEPKVAALMTEYLEIRMFGILTFVGVEALGNWYGGLGNTRLPMIVAIVSMIVDLALNYVLIYGHLGLPALGVAGAAWSTVIGSGVGFGILLIGFLRGWGGAGRGGPVGLRRAEFWKVLRYGTPNGLNWFLEFAAFAVFVNVVVGTLGTTALAAMMVVFNVNGVAFMPSFGISSAGAILAGQAIGSGRRDDVPRVLKLTALTAAAWQCGVGLFYVALPGVLTRWFTPPGGDGALLRATAAVLLALSAIWQLFDAIAMATGETLRAAGDTAWCLYARVILAWLVFMPAAFLTVEVLDGGHVGAILCVAGYIALLAAAFIYRFRSGRWRSIDLIGDGDPLPAAALIRDA